MNFSLIFYDEGCGSLVEEMSKVFLRNVSALKVHEECGIGEVRPAPLKVMKWKLKPRCKARSSVWHKIGSITILYSILKIHDVAQNFLMLHLIFISKISQNRMAKNRGLWKSGNKNRMIYQQKHNGISVKEFVWI